MINPCQALLRSICTITACLSMLLTASGEERPNILVVLVDDLGVMDSSVPFLTGPDGTPVVHPLNRRYRTPQLERLAGQGPASATFSR